MELNRKHGGDYWRTTIDRGGDTAFGAPIFGKNVQRRAQYDRNEQGSIFRRTDKETWGR